MIFVLGERQDPPGRFARIVGLTLVTLIAALSCEAEGVDFSRLEASESTARERAKVERVALMSLEVMFPEPELRSLAQAAGNGELARIEELVAARIDVNSRGSKNATPLYWSLRKESLSGFSRLLELGADPNVVFGVNVSVMHRAAKIDDSRFLRAALQFGGDPNLLGGPFSAPPLFNVQWHDTTKVDLLLDAGADINAIDRHGFTLVSLAAGTLQFRLVYTLLTRGAKYRDTDEDGPIFLDILAAKRRRVVRDPDSELAVELNRVIAWLDERGVEIPE